MDSNFETEPEDLVEELEEDYESYEMDGRRPPKKPRNDPFFRWQYIIAICLIILILIFFYFRSGKSVPDEQIRSMASSIEELKKSMKDLNGRLSRLQQSLSELDRSKGNVSKRMDTLNSRVDRMEKSVSSMSGTLRELGEVKKSSVSEVKNRSYEVRRGDTLFGIAKKHNMTVEKLLGLNGMKKGQKIYPGQKLIVE